MRHHSRLEPLGGNLLRYTICVVLRRRKRWMSVAELTAAILELGFTLPPNANKAVGDAIRWEVRKGRVKKDVRNRYSYGAAPRTTEFRMRRAVVAALDELGHGASAITLGEFATRPRTPAAEDDVDPDAFWVTTADGRRALDMDALEAYEASSRRP